MPSEHFCLKMNEIKDYWTHLFKNDTSSGDMDEMVDHWLDSFETFHKKYINMHSLSLNSLLIEERSPSGFNNPENKTRCYFYSNFQLLYFNVFLENWYSK